MDSRPIPALSIAALGAVLLLYYPPARGDTTGTWFNRSSLPTPRQEVAHVVINGKIYVPGGLAQGGVGSTVVEVFDPLTNTWSTTASMPDALHHLGVATAHGKMYVLGGYVGNSFTPTDHVYEFVPDSNIWRQKTPMLVARGAHVALEFGGKIYVIGGVLAGGLLTGRTDEYDPVSDSWTVQPAMPTAREHVAGGVIDSLLYVIGGRVGASNRNTLEAYSPMTQTWYALPGMPTARSGLAAAALQGRLYVFGGEIPGVFPQNEEYDPFRARWRTMAPMPTPRHGIGAGVVGDSIFIIGGAAVQGFGVTDVNEVFTPDQPFFVVSPTSVHFGGLPVSQCRTESVMVRNTGTSVLTISSAQSSNPRFFISPTSASMNPGDSLYFRIRFCADFPLGMQTGSGVFTHNAAWSPDTVSLAADVVTHVAQTIDHVPEDFVLFQNYPNPFNPGTCIAFALPVESFVTLRIYDPTGAEVTTLAEEEFGPGHYEVMWDASGVASGVYLCRLEAGTTSRTRKLLLVR